MGKSVNGYSAALKVSVGSVFVLKYRIKNKIRAYKFYFLNQQDVR